MKYSARTANSSLTRVMATVCGMSMPKNLASCARRVQTAGLATIYFPCCFQLVIVLKVDLTS